MWDAPFPARHGWGSLILSVTCLPPLPSARVICERSSRKGRQALRGAPRWLGARPPFPRELTSPPRPAQIPSRSALGQVTERMASKLGMWIGRTLAAPCFEGFKVFCNSARRARPGCMKIHRARDWKTGRRPSPLLARRVPPGCPQPRARSRPILRHPMPNRPPPLSLTARRPLPATVAAAMAIAI